MRELPEGWAICKLGDYIKLKNGFAFKSQDYIEKKSDTFPVIRISDIDGQYASDLNAVHVSKNQVVEGFEVESGDLLIAMSGATTGKIGVYIGVSIAYQNQRVGNLKLISEADGCSSFRNHLISRLSGKILEDAYGGAQPNISGKAIEDLEIPLPPLNEQKRIADRLDQLLTRTDKTKAHLDRIPLLLKRFRQSVLAAATSGKLTADWRENDGPESVQIDLDTLYPISSKWNWVIISEIGTVRGGKRLPKGESLVQRDTGQIYIKAGNLKNGTVVADDLMFVPHHLKDVIKRYIVSGGDVYVTIVGACIGDSGIIPNSLDGANLTENAAKICNLKNCTSNFLAMWLQSPICQQLIQENTLSAAQGKLALFRIEQLPLPLPPIEEQQEIVRRVEALFAKADRIEAQYKNARQQVDRLTPALLAKAFRGELVPQDPKDEPASVLLERVKEARSIAQPAKAKRKAVK